MNFLYSNTRNFNGTNAIEACELFASAAICNNLSSNLISGNRPTSYKVSPFTLTSTTLLVGTEFSTVLVVTNANTSNPTFTDISGSNFLGSVSDVEFGLSEQEIYVTMHNYGVENIWYTNDGGNTWSAKEGNLPDIPIKAILPNPLLPGEVIIGTELGVFATSDFNSANPTWQPLRNGMTNVRVVDLDLRTVDNTILATTHGRGMFTGTFDTLSISQFESENLNIQIYPTISNGNITISSALELPETEIKVFNLSGQQVFNTIEDLGVSESRLELDLKSGFYLIQLSVNGQSKTEKIIIK